MELPQVVSYDEWLTARKELLDQEKEETKRRDALRANRRELPMVEVEKDYVFTGPDGEVRLADMFDGRRQLLVQHFMFDPEWEDGCSSCTYTLDDFGDESHLNEMDITFAVVSLAPIEKIEAYREKRAWDVAWYSSHGSDFNYDFQATIDPDVAPVFLNFRNVAELEEAGLSDNLKGEYPGYSVFLLDDGRVFHTYSTYARGMELLISGIQFIDLTPLGRQEG